MPDLTPISTATGGGTYSTWGCKFKNISSADKDTLVTFLRANRATIDITWTIDGIGYSGSFTGGYRLESKSDSVHTVTFTYYAAAV